MRGFVFCAVVGVLLLQQGKSDYDYDESTYDDDYGETTVPSVTPRFLPESVELTATVGESVTFPCQVEIPDGTDVLWKKEEPTYGLVTDISNLEGDRFRIVNGSSLRISDVVPTDSGIYSCQIDTEPAVASSHILKVTSRLSHRRYCSHKSEKWIDLGGDYCYLIEQENHVKWIEAVYKCFQEGGSLATLPSMEEVKRLKTYLNDASDSLYIGLWKHNDGSFEWVDKSTSDFRNWDTEEPNQRSETCVEISMESGKWNDIDCSKYAGYVCSSLKSEEAAPPSRKVCPDSSLGWQDYGSEYCYIIELDSTTSSDTAAEHCSAEGGSLASFHSIEEISVVREHIKHHHDRLHIGFRQNGDGMFEWSDRSPVDLIFWDYGEPNDIEERCGEIYPNTGLWNDIPCSKIVGYICSTPKVDPEIAATEAPPATTAEICGGDIIAESGTIKSPNYPENYSPNVNCLWKITVPEASQIILYFEELQLEYGAYCEFDYVEILDGNEPDSTVLRRLCGSSAGEIVSSLGNQMSVKFLSDRVNQRKGFVAKFKTVEQCGESIVAEEGVIYSRHYPENYLPNDVCTWKITVPENNVVRLRFKAFETQSSGGCVKDYVEVLDGHDASSPILQRYCGLDIPDEIHSSGHKMTVTFVSDSSEEYYGFALEFMKADVGSVQPTADVGDLFPPIQPSDEYEDECQDTIDYEKGTLVNPGYPSHYKSFENCIWNIRTSPGSTISLKFKTFELENSDTCSYDSVEVYNGPEVSSRPLGKFCGHSVPDLITSSGNQMSVHFKTDSSVQHQGFSATFSTLSGSMTGIGEVQNETFHISEDGCGGNIISDEGIIQSPSYPALYGPGTQCSWKITVPRGHQVVLKFTDFKVEGHIRCAYDYVLIRDGHSPRSRVLSKICGYEIPGEIRSSGNKLMIELKSDSSGEYSGFSAEFKKVPAVSTGIPSQEFGPCGGYIHDENGTIQSPNFPLPYEPLQNCTWKITVPEDSQIFLEFDSVDLEYGPDCQFDQVTVLDGDDAVSPTIGKICADEGKRILSSRNKITVKFASDDTFELTGFKGTFRKVLSCGGNITAEKGFFQSPSGTGGYACTWRITVPENYTVQLKIRADPMPYDPKRFFEMEIRKGLYMDSELEGQYYSLDDNITVRSSTNEMLIVVTSYGSEELPHLQAEFEQYSCGGDVSGDAGAFLSPNYPGKYGKNEDCTWRITVPENYQVVLTFSNIQLEYGSSCNFDYVEIREGHSPSGPVIRRFCGDVSPVVHRSETNKISVRFVSDSSGQYQGFTAQFEKDSFQTDYSDTCNRYITAERGIISSPSYPSNYPGYTHCSYKIRVPEANSVVLKFNAFDLEPSETCQYDYVKVFDGHDNLNSRLLGTYCGTGVPEAIHSTTDKITVVFESDSSVTAAGFSAEFFGETVSYSELEDLLRQMPNMIFEQAKVKPKPSSSNQKKKKKLPVMKRSLVESLQKTFKLI